MKSLSRENQADIIEAFNSTSRYLDDLLNIQGLTNQKKNPLAHWASKFFFHLPSSNSYLPRICAAQIPICPRFANRNRSLTFNIVLTSL